MRTSGVNLCTLASEPRIVQPPQPLYFRHGRSAACRSGLSGLSHYSLAEWPGPGAIFKDRSMSGIVPRCRNVSVAVRQTETPRQPKQRPNTLLPVQRVKGRPTRRLSRRKALPPQGTRAETGAARCPLGIRAARVTALSSCSPGRPGRHSITGHAKSALGVRLPPEQ